MIRSEFQRRGEADLTRLLQHLSREPLICDVRVRVGKSVYGAEIPAAFQAAAFEQIARYIRMTTPAIAMHPSTRAVAWSRSITLTLRPLSLR